jgi:hypothetical protein
MGIDSYSLITQNALADYEIVKALRVVLRIGYIRSGLAKKSAQIALWVKDFQILGALPGSNKFYGDAAFTFDRQSYTALGRTIHLRQN